MLFVFLFAYVLDSLPAKALALVHVNVVDVTVRSILSDQTVVIAGDRILRVGPAQTLRASENAQVVDAHGLYLIPGLWDMHVHIWDADLAFPLFLANGLTGVRNMGGYPDELKLWRQELQEGKRFGPRLLACGPVVDGPPPIHADHSVVVESANQARSAVDDLKSQGWDFVKVYDNVSRDVYFAIAREAKKDGIAFVGHVPVSVTALEASTAGQKSIEHQEGFEYVISPLGDNFRRNRLERIGKPPQPGEMMKIPMRIASELNQLADTYDEGRAGSLFAELVRNNTWSVPTLSVARVYGSIGSAAVYADDRLNYVARQERDGWEHNPIVHLEVPPYVEARRREFRQAIRIAKAAHAAGVRTLAGTDSGGVPYIYYGSSLHDELALLVDAGFTPMESLQAATVQAARFLGLDDRLGTVTAGKQADLVLLNANPLDDIHNTRKIRAVIAGGRYLDRNALDALLEQAKARAQR
jgi:cytosine/adenosine deaminase-related metal-dependent hydrolase